MRKSPSPSLSEAADELVLEVRGGRWEHVGEVISKPPPACMTIVDELRRRCPSKTTEQYQQAIADSLQATR
jgi:hypothetical protein